MTRGLGTEVNGGDGDRVKIEVDLEGGVVMSARASGSGCEVSTKASSAVTRLARGRSRSEALALAITDVTGQIGPLDADRQRCALTAIAALRAAILDAHMKAIA